MTDIYSLVNKGKGIILFPSDVRNHPTVGLTIAPYVPALDCIEINGGTLPDWVVAARAEAAYDDTCDKTSPPTVTAQTGTIRSIELEAFGGYCLKVGSTVCPLHPTQGIFRKNGQMQGRLYTLTRKYIYSTDATATFTQDATARSNAWCVVADFTPVPVSNSYPLVKRVPSKYFGGYVKDLYVGDDIEAAIVNSTGGKFKASVFNNAPYAFKANESVRYKLISTTISPISYTTNTATSYSYSFPGALNYSKSNVLYISPDCINPNFSSTGASTQHGGIHSIADGTTRCTAAGFMTGTNKGLVVTSELRRNFLRISPTVFKHIGGY